MCSVWSESVRRVFDVSAMNILYVGFVCFNLVVVCVWYTCHHMLISNLCVQHTKQLPFPKWEKAAPTDR